MSVKQKKHLGKSVVLQKSAKQSWLSRLWQKPLGKVVCSVITILVLSCILQLGSTLIAHIVYKGRSYPNLVLADSTSGSRQFDQIYKKLATEISNTNIKITVQQETTRHTPAELGISLDKKRLEHSSLKRDLRRLITPLFIPDKRPLPIVIDDSKLNQVIAKSYQDKGFKPYVNAKFTVKDGKLRVTEGKDGIGLDSQPFITTIKQHYESSVSDLSYTGATTDIHPMISGQDIRLKQSDILAFTKLKFGVRSDSETFDATEAEKAGWLTLKRNGNLVVIDTSTKNINRFAQRGVGYFEQAPKHQVTTKYLSGKANTTSRGVSGRTVINKRQVMTKLQAAAANKQSEIVLLKFQSVPFAKQTRTVDDRVVTRVYTYEVVKWGNPKADLESFASLAAQTYTDSRGWNKAGIIFKRVSSGGDFTLVLAEPSRVAAASPGCSSYYSCNVGRYVIINDDRWRGATDPWNANGGSLRDYQHMVVNHETGHWLGLGHGYCSGAGQKAPVMQQQSIDLQGCTFNPWPVASEIATL